MNKIKKSEYEIIIGLYDGGMKQVEIAKLYNVSSTTIANVLSAEKKKRGIRTTQVTDEEVKKMYDTYMSGKSIKEVSKVFSVSESCVQYNFAKRNLKTRDRSTMNLKYHIDKHYFDKIDTPNKAYILGLLYADGCHPSNKDAIQLALQEQDVGVLNLIKEELQTDRPLYFVSSEYSPLTKHNQYRLDITNQHIARVLDSYGVHSRKSLTLEWPEWMEQSLVRHFIRGYLDGDGCIYFNHKTSECKIYIASTENFCNSMKNVIFDLISVNTSITQASGGNKITKVLNIGGNRQVYKFLNWIYADADLLIERKYKKYLDFVNYYKDISNTSQSNELVG
jgi:transposase